MAYRETYFKKFLKENGIIGKEDVYVDVQLMDVLHKVYYMGIARAIERPTESKQLYNQIKEQHYLDYD